MEGTVLCCTDTEDLMTERSPFWQTYNIRHADYASVRWRLVSGVKDDELEERRRQGRAEGIDWGIYERASRLPSCYCLTGSPRSRLKHL